MAALINPKNINVPFELAYISAGVWLSLDWNSHLYDQKDLYVAGLMDGEGHIGINRSTKRNKYIQHITRTQIVSTDFELIEILKSYGGSAKIKDSSKWNKNANPCLVWNIYGQQNLQFLKKIGPLLKSNRKRASARWVMAIEQSRLPKGGACKHHKEINIHEYRDIAHKKVVEINSRLYENYQDAVFEKDTTKILADALIRILDIAGAHNLDLDGAIKEKRAYNANREDHKPTNRRLQTGKKF